MTIRLFRCQYPTRSSIVTYKLFSVDSLIDTGSSGNLHEKNHHNSSAI